jgi:DNA-binding response OmpR family regulator
MLSTVSEMFFSSGSFNNAFLSNNINEIRVANEIFKARVALVSDDSESNNDISEFLLNPSLGIDFAIFNGDVVFENFVENFKYDLIIFDLDIKLHSDKSFLVKILNSPKLESVPKILISKNNTIEYKISVLESNVDEFLNKPISVPELITKSRNLIKRYRGLIKARKLNSGDLEIDLIDKSVFFKGKEIDLSGKEFAILRLLVSSPGKIFTRDNILNLIWKNNKYVNARTIDVHINRLRVALRDPENKSYSYIRTIRGEGYSFNSNQTFFKKKSQKPDLDSVIGEYGFYQNRSSKIYQDQQEIIGAFA